VRRILFVLALAFVAVGRLDSQEAARVDSSLLTVDRIFASREFASAGIGAVKWLPDGSGYVVFERGEGGRDLVRYDAQSGAREVLVPARRFQPAGDTVPLPAEDFTFSPNGRKLLIFTNSERVWRLNTRGDYWVLDLDSWSLAKLGGAAARPSTLMFAKFSPDGGRVGYVREFNLYVEDLAGRRITQLTRDGSRTTINGTFDWVYEEELVRGGVADGWRWSPDGRSIAYWQLDATGVRDFVLVNNTDSIYSSVVPVQYPKAGGTNSAARIGVVSATGGNTRWMLIPGDPRRYYLARLEWAPPVGAAPMELLIQQLNRRQDSLVAWLADPRSGAARVLLVETDSAWVEPSDTTVFVNGGRDIVWLSERDGWYHFWLVSRATGEARVLTPGDFDVLGDQGVDQAGGWLYFVASPQNIAERRLYRARLDASGTVEAVTPAGSAGTHLYVTSPNWRFALHLVSRFDTPPTLDVVRLPDHQSLRTLYDNAALRGRLARLRLGRTEFTQITLPDGRRLNARLIRPADFDPSRRYPLLIPSYGAPLPLPGGSQLVTDAWGGAGYLWHQMLAQHGYVIAEVDGIGTHGRGRAWRKAIYARLGQVEVRDQAEAARVMGRWPSVDSTRIGMWGWSGGGTMSLHVILQYPDVFRTALAVAPLVDFRFYDTIYTERYMGLPQDNAQAYERGSPVTYARNLRGNLLVVHGTGDDNVHVQNTEAMVNALVAANRQFSLMLYPNRTHGIFGGNTTRHLREMLTRFVLERL